MIVLRHQNITPGFAHKKSPARTAGLSLNGLDYYCGVLCPVVVRAGEVLPVLLVSAGMFLLAVTALFPVVLIRKTTAITATTAAISTPHSAFERLERP
jgi:hypothetical protein